MKKIFTVCFAIFAMSLFAQEITIISTENGFVVDRGENEILEDSAAVARFYKVQLNRLHQQEARQKAALENIRVEKIKYNKAYHDFIGDWYGNEIRENTKDNFFGTYNIRTEGKVTQVAVYKNFDFVEQIAEKPRTGKLKIENEKIFYLTEFFGEGAETEFIYDGKIWFAVVDKRKVFLRKVSDNIPGRDK